MVLNFGKNRVRNHWCCKGVCLDCKCLCSLDKSIYIVMHVLECLRVSNVLIIIVQ